MKWAVELRKERGGSPVVIEAGNLEDLATRIVLDDCSSFDLISKIGNPDFYTRILERRVAELRQAMALLANE